MPKPIDRYSQGVSIDDTAIGTFIEALEANYPEPGLRLDSAAVPNPFYGVSSSTFPDSDQTILNLVDGGLDGEVTPYQPLLVKARGVDTILAIDAVSLLLLLFDARSKLVPGRGYFGQLGCRPFYDCTCVPQVVLSMI